MSICYNIVFAALARGDSLVTVEGTYAPFFSVMQILHVVPDILAQSISAWCRCNQVEIAILLLKRLKCRATFHFPSELLPCGKGARQLVLGSRLITLLVVRHAQVISQHTRFWSGIDSLL